LDKNQSLGAVHIRQVLLDGNPLPNNLIPLADDGKQHEVIVLMDSAVSPQAEKYL